jgi:hypothetical protein
MFVHNDEVHWDMNFIILVHDWEVDTITFFFSTLYSVRRIRGDEDKCCWVPSKRRYFEVKIFYKVLLPNVNHSGPWKSI